MTKEELVKILDQYLLGDISNLNSSGGAMTDILKALAGPGPDLAIFILGACFIDAMASFRYGVTKEILAGRDRKSGKRFKDFVKEYLPEMYHRNSGDDFYVSLRCGLVHNYVERFGAYAFSSSHDKSLHHQPTNKGQIIINREKFIDELKEAYYKLRNDILEQDQVFRNAEKRLDSLGLMGVSDLDSLG